MTRRPKVRPAASGQLSGDRWRLQDAKARFSQLVRMARSDGPQLVTVRGHDAVVVVDAGEFARLKGARTGELLIEALRASPHREVDIEPRRAAMPVPLLDRRVDIA
jgi:prevent-host-death family protein